MVGIPQVTLYSFVKVLSGFAAGPSGQSWLGQEGPQASSVMKRSALWPTANTKAVLSLVYSIVKSLSLNVTSICYLVEPGGLEPPTSALQRRRSPS